MYSKLNLKNIIDGHYNSLGKGKLNSNYFKHFVLIPFVFAFLLVVIKVPDNDVKNIFGICLSILTGLYLNILVLLISSISTEGVNIGVKHKKIRLELLEETLYNVSFSVFVSVKALIFLFLSTILIFDFNNGIDGLLLILFNYDLNYLIQFILGFYLYKYTIDIFLILFIILKRINILYTKEIYIEKLKLNKLENKENK